MSSPVITIAEGVKTKNRGGVFCKDQGMRVGEDNKGGKKQEDEERGGGMCP